MKKIVKSLLSTLLAISLLGSTTSAFAAETNSSDIITKEQVTSSNTKDSNSSDDISKPVVASNVRKNVEILENELKANNTDVVAQLQNQISRLKTKKNTVKNEKDKDKIDRLISTTESMVDMYNNDKSGITAQSKIDDPTIRDEIAAVVAYFDLKGYSLASELLEHAYDNDDLDSIYSPVYGDRVEDSPVFKRIAKNSSKQGSDIFPNSGSTIQKDLYYAIHEFYYLKNDSTITISDLYDFAPGTYGGIAGVAINAMYEAQQLGVLVPFYTYIEVNY